MLIKSEIIEDVYTVLFCCGFNTRNKCHTPFTSSPCAPGKARVKIRTNGTFWRERATFLLLIYSGLSNNRVYTRACILFHFPLYMVLLDSYTTRWHRSRSERNFFPKFEIWFKFKKYVITKYKYSITFMQF